MSNGQARSSYALLLAGFFLAQASIALTSGARAASAADAADLSGPDRMQKLVDGAKKEGGLELYSSATVEDMAPIIAGFEKKYGLKVRVWRGSATDIRQRAVTEARSGHSELDVVEAAGPDVEALQRENLLQEIKSPTFADLIPGSLPPHRQWTLDRISVITAAYNTNVITKAQAPKSYDDLTDPNGLAFSPNERTLYVSDTSRARFPDDGNHHVLAFDVIDGRSLGSPRVFKVIEPGVSDGLRVDVDGNVWTSAGDGIHVLTPDGTELGRILLPEAAANCTFAGPDGRTLFITATSTLWSIEVGIRGDVTPWVDGGATGR